MENKTYARESTLYKARDRQRIGQKRKVRHRRPNNLRNSQKGLITARAQSYGKNVCKKTKKKNTPCYVFSFTRLLPPDNASFHSCDLWYALGSLGDSLRPFTQADYDLSDEMVDRFSAFAKSQNPNVDGKPQWNVYSSKPDIKVFK